MSGLSNSRRSANAFDVPIEELKNWCAICFRERAMHTLTMIAALYEAWAQDHHANAEIIRATLSFSDQRRADERRELATTLSEKAQTLRRQAEDLRRPIPDLGSLLLTDPSLAATASAA